MLWALILVLIVLWLIGLALDIFGALINILLVFAAIVLVIELVRRLRTPT
ncbi:MAG: lmo0937 family membrane protein [Chloroflexota bacterium]|nr:lmo0937 family membrane protein [Chloroflexota bacterium]